MSIILLNVFSGFFNDLYDWDGIKELIVYLCEADSDVALTMQIMELVPNKPVIFTNYRYFDKNEGVFVFCNCGVMSTRYSKRRTDPKENLKSVSLCPVIPKYGGKDCHVLCIAKEAKMTFWKTNKST